MVGLRKNVESLLGFLWFHQFEDQSIQTYHNTYDFTLKPFPRLYPFSSSFPRLAFSFFLQ